MILGKGSLFTGFALSLVLFSSQAQAHWCDDLWASSYNIVVKPDSDTSPQNIYVQNNMGYQLINFKLTATGTGGAITLTAPTLKVSGTLMPGEKGTWKVASGSPAKIEDVTFAVSFGNSGQSGRYPTQGAKAVMVVKNDGSLYPASTTLPGLDNPSCCGDVTQARSLQYQAAADFEDVNTGLDSLLKLYCSGRGSFGSTDGVSQTYCKDSSSTSCPTSKPTSGSGSKYDYMHLWAAGELAVRKASLGARLPVLRARLQCGVNDGDVGFAGYALFILGYLGDDATAKAFIQTQVTAGGDLGTIGKAALYVMGDTTQKADVQAGAKASSVFVQAACAAALGIVDKDDATVTSVLIPLVKWNEPDTSDDGKGLFAGHILELVAFDRRGWVAKGVGTGAVTFYGESGSTPGTGGSGGGAGGATGLGGATGSGGASGNKDGSPSDVKLVPPDTAGNGGATGPGGGVGSGGKAGGGATSVAGSGGKTGAGGAIGAGGTTSAAGTTGTGGTSVSAGGSTGSGSSVSSGGASGGNGGASGSGGDTGDGTTPATASTGCKCNVRGHGQGTPSMDMLAVAALAWIFGRRRRR